jgi:2-polyprenyl-6-methoxyphenol hydroxylase-like FAD-dependent oxidoreductase
MADFDVLIAGAGPAGCTAAISLAQFAPTLRVCLVDGPPAQPTHIGETVPPAIRPMLEHLGLWASFEADGHSPSYRTLSAWGGPELASNEFLFQTRQTGWRLDRARFDAMMRDAALACVSSHVRAKLGELVLADGEWRATLHQGPALTARFALDATGRAAALTRAIGHRPVDLDRLVGCFVEFAGTPDDGEGLMIESAPDGWWYTAAIPGERRVVAYMTDSDLARSVADLDGWMAALQATTHVRATVAAAQPLGPPRLRPAGSRGISDEITKPLLCVGDAASCFDPISGQGIIKALRSGVFASYAVGDLLCRSDATGVARYRSLVAREFAEYRKTLAGYYALERRSAERPFWHRRQESSFGAPIGSAHPIMRGGAQPVA